jgi:hypothetical protein
VRDVVRRVLEDHGRIDVLVNNAAVQVEALAADVTVEDFQRVVDVNLLGCVLFCREVLPAMVGAGSGSIVNMSSVNAFSADPLLPVYGATKRHRLHEERGDRVRTARHPRERHLPRRRRHRSAGVLRGTRIRPGSVAIEREYPVRRIASTDEIARVAVFSRRTTRHS